MTRDISSPNAAWQGQLSSKNENPFQEALVFVLGGDRSIEYHNLVDYIRGKPGKHILYDCSEHSNAFIKFHKTSVTTQTSKSSLEFNGQGGAPR